MALGMVQVEGRCHRSALSHAAVKVLAVTLDRAFGPRSEMYIKPIFHPQNVSKVTSAMQKSWFNYYV